MVLIAVVTLACLARTTAAAVSTAVFGVSAVTLFTMSAVYHLGSWSPRKLAVLRSVDHADILVLIAGTYTPLAVLALRGGARVAVLSVVWAAAALSAVFQVAWTALPRLVYVLLYAGLGWTALFMFPQLLHGAGWTVLALYAAGGVVYTAGGVVYGLKRPDPWPRVFGFHEVFHSCTVAAFACQYAAVALLVCRA